MVAPWILRYSHELPCKATTKSHSGEGLVGVSQIGGHIAPSRSVGDPRSSATSTLAYSVSSVWKMLRGVVVSYGIENGDLLGSPPYGLVSLRKMGSHDRRQPRIINGWSSVKRCQGIASVLQALLMLWSGVVRMVWGIISKGQGEGPWHWELSRRGWRRWSPLSRASLQPFPR